MAVTRPVEAVRAEVAFRQTNSAHHTFQSIEFQRRQDTYCLESQSEVQTSRKSFRLTKEAAKSIQSQKSIVKAGFSGKAAWQTTEQFKSSRGQGSSTEF